jgi:hypothetical protein
MSLVHETYKSDKIDKSDDDGRDTEEADIGQYRRGRAGGVGAGRKTDVG